MSQLQSLISFLLLIPSRHKSVMSSRELLIVFGSVYRLDHYNDDDSRRVDVVVVHPNYSRFNSYDVALLRMVSRIPGNMRHVKPIIKRKKINIKRGMKCTTLGWGQLYLVKKIHIYLTPG